MDQDIRKKIGRSETLHIDLHLYADDRHPRDQAWGNMSVVLKGSPIWFTESEAGDEVPVSWSWIDLLEFLGDNWPWLVMEEQYPLPINPLHPGTMRREAESRWERLSRAQHLDEDDRLFQFEVRHDLAMGLKGIFLPSLFVLRQGNLGWVCTNDDYTQIPFAELLQTLTGLGDCLAAYVAPASEPRARRAHQRWQNRKQYENELFWTLRTGMGVQARSKVEQGELPHIFWETGEADHYADNEIFAAARLSSGIISFETQMTLLQRIKATTYYQTTALDSMADKVVRELDTDLRPYEQGYQVAQTLRYQLDLPENSRIDPESILRDWGVAIQEAQLDDCPLDAVAAWGPQHGPVIILNTGAGTRSGHSHGRRSTLAHEICHLLVDRQGTLPFSEVLGGHTPLYVEQRARAFAAEFLLARSSAVSAIRKYDRLEESLEHLKQKFGVSVELAALQIKNSDAFFGLNEEDRNTIQRITEKHPGVPIG